MSFSLPQQNLEDILLSNNSNISYRNSIKIHKNYELSKFNQKKKNEKIFKNNACKKTVFTCSKFLVSNQTEKSRNVPTRTNKINHISKRIDLKRNSKLLVPDSNCCKKEKQQNNILDEPSKIKMAKLIDGNLYFWICWQPRSDGTTVGDQILPHRFIKEKYPHILLNFYESRLKFEKFNLH